MTGGCPQLPTDVARRLRVPLCKTGISTSSRCSVGIPARWTFACGSTTLSSSRTCEGRREALGSTVEGGLLEHLRRHRVLRLHVMLWKRRRENGYPVGMDPTWYFPAISITHIRHEPEDLLSSCTREYVCRVGCAFPFRVALF